MQSSLRCGTSDQCEARDRSNKRQAEKVLLQTALPLRLQVQLLSCHLRLRLLLPLQPLLPLVMEQDKCSPVSSHNNNNKDNGSSGSSDDGDGHISISCEETSALFDDSQHHRGSSGPWSTSKVRLVWNDVCYTVQTMDWNFPSLKLPVRSSKVILNRNSGRIESGRLTACIGPSGAGKSSLLEILAGRREKGVSGSIAIHYDSKKHASSTKIAFMGQKDVFCGTLTVRETLMFASRLKNCSAQTRLTKKVKAGQSSHLKLNDATVVSMQEHTDVRNYHANLVSDIMDELSLTGCAHVFVSSCSGGQQKRLSIACELLSRPDILLLDEPTSGLDSFSAFQCIHLLKKLTQTKSLAVILSIHQPSSQTLSLFDQLYVLSHDGRCLYSGDASAVQLTLKEHGLECPMFYNPADFIIEIASGDLGPECMDRMSKQQMEVQQECSGLQEGEHEVKLSRVVDKMMRKPLPLMAHTWTLLKRSLLVSWREPMLASLSLFQHVFVGIVMGIIFSSSSGGLDGCYKAQHVNPAHFTMETLKEFQREEIYTQQNVGFLFFALIFQFLAAMMATVLTFPLEMGVFMKERSNRWYSCASYYLARTLADTPYRILFSSIYAVIIYRMTGQIDEDRRFLGFVVLYVLVAFVAQAKGLLIGSLYANDVGSAVFVAPLSTIPVVLFAGFFVKLEGLPAYLSALPVISYFKYAFEASIILIYGFDRCSTLTSALSNVTHNPFYDLHQAMGSVNISLAEMTPMMEFYLESNGVNGSLIDNLVHRINMAENATKSMFASASTRNFTSTSYVMSHFETSDGAFLPSFFALLSFFLLFRFFAYLVLYFKSSPKK